MRPRHDYIAQQHVVGYSTIARLKTMSTLHLKLLMYTLDIFLVC